ncbi:MAG: flagellar basal body rod protein FlgC [Pseudomonadales bacterium]
MPLMDIFDIAGSAMNAQNLRLNTTASNLANADSVSSNRGETYRARHPVFAARLAEQTLVGDPRAAAIDQAATGVMVTGIVESDAPLQMKYEPHHPMADDNGYVAYPNVNVVEEMADMMSASRSFQVNVQMLTTVKSMAERLLSMGQ